MTPTEIVLAIFGTLGCFAVGSFVCVVIERLPVRLEEPDEFGDLYGVRRWSEVLGGSSRCASCETPVSWFLNVPVIAWLALRGRCRSCGASIPGFHPLVEAAVPLVTVGLVIAYGWGWRISPALWLVPVGIAAAVIDLRTMIVPTRIVWPAFGVTVVLSAVASVMSGESRWLVGGLIGVACMAGPLALLWFALPGGMGFGDVRLATLLGWTVGFCTIEKSPITAVFTSVTALALSAVLGLIMGVVGLVAFGRGRKVPFGPALVAGALIVIGFGEDVLNGFAVT